MYNQWLGTPEMCPFSVLWVVLEVSNGRPLTWVWELVWYLFWDILFPMSFLSF